MITKQDVFNKLKANPKLPTPSKTALKVLRICRSDSYSLSEIAQIIQVDPAISSEVLKFANSAFMATGIQVASIERATVKLGMDTVVHLALCFSLLTSNKSGDCWEFDYDNFWSASLAQAIAAKNLTAFDSRYDPDEIFICALLSHVGELALASLFPREYGAIISDQPSREVRINREIASFGIDSAELTTELFLDWGLPAPYALAAGFHEDLSTADLGQSTIRNVTELLHISYVVSLLCHGAKVSRQWLDATENMIQRLEGINDEFGTIFDTIVNHWHEWGQTFNINTRPCLRYDEIKADIYMPGSEK
jgi:HD-like signal output (HDOD) protein